MRQLKGKVAKETSKMKNERKKAFQEGHDKVLTVALPIIFLILTSIIAYVVFKTQK